MQRYGVPGSSVRSSGSGREFLAFPVICVAADGICGAGYVLSEGRAGLFFRPCAVRTVWRGTGRACLPSPNGEGLSERAGVMLKGTGCERSSCPVRPLPLCAEEGAFLFCADARRSRRRAGAEAGTFSTVSARLKGRAG